ncbi:type III pantothenate kinase [Nitrosomonas sp.]|uniref:type III pantothenate kinase n=1 Tax=Nitrosomonas sp. TaxID=42353 RepID=UPI0025E453E1|nr:type III pantothenate kinase [Nitrosomonas sp.]MCC6917418.1 type III pantothenate kinase [Nitrosomonas sp.]
MSTSFVLAIDSGNTAIKWGLHDGERWLANGSTLQDRRMMLKQSWTRLPIPSLVLISNVAGLQAEKDLAVLLQPWQVPPRLISAKASQCGVINRYTRPEQLGCDRWMALIAARHRVQRACLVVDIGTAMTADALAATGEFLGGIIVPGPDTMKQALAGRAGTFAIPNSGSFQNFPINTANALFSGMIQALTGALERMHDQLSSYSNGQIPAEIILTGGGAALLAPHIRISHQIVDNLVLEGLIIIAGEQE